ncbi:SDR family NAD(P)-dependent oxidoreductase, partial [Streptomyces sp. CHA16]|uniref:SDR family NAD(P)-dependent oxidoreductase n=1 Tax=Streptomyces sp. CHA16 TaxID=2841667 RepID=UPI002095995E
MLLTGASSGIGRELALVLAARGTRLVLTARRADRLEAVAGEIARRGHPRPATITADLAQRGAASELADQAQAAVGT